MCRQAWSRLPAATCLLGGLCRVAQGIYLQVASGFEVADYDFDKVRRHAGLYANKTAHPEFNNTVLVTASNAAYSNILWNWRCHADKLGLDYIIVALDPDIYKEAGGSQSLLIEGNYYREAQTFRQGHFNQISCSKLQVVLDIMNETGLNVVFSDPDNVFRDDPFANGTSLGDKMRLGKFQYIYQQNHNWRNVPNESSIGAEVEEGNTGFYFASGSTKTEGVQSLFQAALMECRKKPGLDDQANFWRALRNVRNGYGRSLYGADSFACASLCGKANRTCAAPGKDVLEYCEMDPRNHATGWETAGWKGPPKIVTYHANYIGGGMEAKIARLERNGFWDAQCVTATANGTHT